MRRFNQDIKTATMALKVLIIALALLNFPGDVLGKDYDIRLMEGKTKVTGVYETPAGDTVVSVAWTAKFGNYDVSDTSEVVKFNVKVEFLDVDGMILYTYSLTTAKVKAGKWVLVKGLESVSLKLYKKMVGCDFKVDRSRQEFDDMLKKIGK